MRRRRSRRRLRALSSRSCSPFERKKRRFLRSLRMPERCICVWNRFRSCSGSSPSRSVTKDKLPTLLELRRPTTEPAAHRRKPIIAVKARSCHPSRGPCSCCVVDEPDSIVVVRDGVDDAHCAPIRRAEEGIPAQRASGMIGRSSVSTTPPSRAAATTLPPPNTHSRFGVRADHSVMALAEGADRKVTVAPPGAARSVVLGRASVGRSPHSHLPLQ